MKHLKLLVLSITLSGCSITASDKNDDIRESLNKANYCDVKSDCIDMGSICPIGCNILINKNEVDFIRPKLDSIKENCEYDCWATQSMLCIDHQCMPIRLK